MWTLSHNYPERSSFRMVGVFTRPILYFHSVAGWLHCNLVTIKVNQWHVQSFSTLLCPLYNQIHGFFKGMAFPVLTVAISNSVVFGSYSNALDYLTQSQRNDRSQGNQASMTAVFTAGCFSGVAQVRWKMERGKNKLISGKNVSSR